MIPSFLNVLGKQYSIIVEPLDGVMGQCDQDVEIIRIHNHQKKFNEADTLVHECFHAIDERFQLSLSERQVYCMAVGLLNVFKDNPALIEYIKEAVKK